MSAPVGLAFNMAVRKGRQGLRDIKRDLRKVRQAQERAAVTALNRTGRDVEKEAIQALSARVNVPKGRLRWHYTLDGTKSNKRRLLVQKAARREKVVGIHWLPKSARPAVSLGSMRPRQTRRGVRAGAHLVPGGFVPKTSPQTLGPRRGSVFKRVTAARLPIEFQEIDLREPADRTFSAFLARSGPKYRREFNKAMDRALKRGQPTRGGR